MASGHNRWSKIKHDKAKEDSKKTKIRTKLAYELFIASKLGGPDPALNSRLALAITSAKLGQLAKGSIEQAIARGQGKSMTGAPLEQVVIEAMLPANVAAIIECHTENKLRTLQDVRSILTRYGGSTTTTSFFFEKKGKIEFQEQADLDADKIMEEVIEAGAADFSIEEGKLVVDTEPTDMIERAEIVFEAKEDTAVSLSPDQEDGLQNILDLLQDTQSVQNVYVNAA
ncbi:putative transcriptional regulatory protein [Cyphellophora attinorum]|uniref:Putative transcriptional regulatory protein n=1 Tax=Cyphellophora attinorum TaxID=1664694 RepID=A0A0N0NNJ2_9EURO|nr:putative transcriptional regulatory protein [Phialophora attinorum]KPI41439.1 putative transcriptional regulatory protein [Phialophora attinorum]